MSSEETKAKARAKRLWDNYKLTIAQYDQLLAYQGGVCYMCHQAEPVKGRRLSVDHDHKTGLIRGLLCSRCNPILGKLERAYMRYGLGKVIQLTIEMFSKRLWQYVESPPATKCFGQPHYGYPGHVGTKAHRLKLRKERKLQGML